MPPSLRRLALLSVLTLILRAGDPPSRPILRLETGAHTAPIEGIAVNVAGNLLATSANDKTLRLWDIATGQPVSVLRPPLGEGQEGGLRACAFSPDGMTLAAGGDTGRSWDDDNSIYLFDLATRSLSGRIRGLPGTVLSLTYARDGRLAANLRADGIRVFQPGGSLAFKDDSYPKPSSGADFDPAGRLVTSCDDGFLRLYDAEGRLLAKVPAEGHPRGVRFSPDGTTVAVGFLNVPKVELRSARDLALQARPDVFRATKSLSQVAWSADGRTLYAAGWNVKGGKRFIRAWRKGGLGSWTEYPASGNTIRGLAPLPDGRVVWAGADADWGILDGPAHSSKTAHFRDMTLYLDPSGTRVSFGYEVGGNRTATFDASSLDLHPGMAPGLQPPRTSTPGMVIADWSQRTFPSRSQTRPPSWNGQPLALEADDGRSLSLAAVPQGGFMLGTDAYLYRFDERGQKRWSVAAPAGAWSVNLSGDGTLAAAIFNDGTIRWYSMDSGKELLACFPHIDGRHWVAWTPSGYYAASPGGEDLIGWHLNRGKEQAADFFPASRFRATYYRPDVIERILQTRDEGRALSLANGAKARQMSDEAEGLRLAAEAKARQAAEAAEAQRLADAASARQRADDAKARELAEKAKAEQLAEAARAMQLANAAEARRLAEQAKAMQLASEAKARQAAAEAEALALANEAKARKLADEARATRLEEEARARQLAEAAKARPLAQEASIQQMLPPVVTILSPAYGQSIATPTLSVKVQVRQQDGKPIDSVWAAVDGRRVDVRGVALKLRQGQGTAYTLEVPVPAQDCVLSVFAQSGAAVSEADSVRLTWAGARAQADQGFVVQPKLYVLAVGISAYKNPDFRLDYPAKDALDFSEIMKQQKSRLYRDVEVRLLRDAEATRDAVLESMEWLERQTTAKDVAIVFMAGHGINDEVGSYFFLPWNADSDHVKTTMIPGREFQETLEKLAGKTLVFMDSCHSGNVLKAKSRGGMDPNRFINELSSAESGVVVFSASTGRQVSQESPEWGNGAFTKAAVEGLSGKADFQHTGRVTINMLDLYISERVKELTRGTQAPTTAKPNTVQDFPIAIVR